MPETAEQYTSRILGYVQGQDAIKVQRSSAAKLKKLTGGLTPKQLKWRPEPAKWSIAEIVAHLADAEVVVGWRLRSVIADNGVTVQPFDQDAWAAVFQYAKRDPKRSIETFRVLRENNLALLREIPKETWENYGMHLERGKESIARLAQLYAGHDTNHILQIERIVSQIKSARPKQKKSAKKKRKAK